MLLISFLALFASIFFLQLGNSILAPFDVLVGLDVGFSNFEIGLLGSSHFLGFLTGCWVVPFIMARVGHIRAFTIFAMLSILGSLLHPIFVDPYFWCFLRILSGLSIAGCFTIAEGWLNAKVTNQNRGKVFGGYRFVDNGGAALGVVFISLLDVTNIINYNTISLLLCLCILPLAFTTNIPPTVPKSPSLNLSKTFVLSPLSFITVFVVGATNPAIRMLGPVFGQDSGFTQLQIGIFLSLALIGGVVAQIPIGYLADRFDRRLVLIVLSFLSVACSATLTITTGNNFYIFSIFVFLFSFCALPLFSVAAAHANDFSEKDFFVDLAASLIFIYGVSAILCTVVVSGLFEIFGSSVLFIYIGMVHLVLCAFGIYRMTVRPTVDDKKPYLVLPRTSLVFLKMFKKNKGD